MILISIIIMICFYCTKINANLTVPAYHKYANKNILDGAIVIANENFNFRSITTVLSKDVDKIYLDMFLKCYKGTVIIETKGEPAPKHVVLFIDSWRSFMNILNKLKPDLKGRTLLSSGAKFLIVLLSSSKKIDRVTKILWRYHVANVLFVVNVKNEAALYTFYPYKNHLNCHNTEPDFIGYWNKEMLGKGSMYPDKMKNMKGCPLYISTNKLYHPSTEQKIPLQVIKKTIIRLLRDTMNFTPIISTRDYISIDSDRAKNWSDSLNDVITGLANISTCSIPLGIDRLGLLDYSMPYFRVRLAWLAPPVNPGPVWWRLLSPLNGYLWLILLVLYFFVTSLPLALKIEPVKKFCYKNFKNINKLHAVAIRIWGMMLGQPIAVTPRRFRDFYILSLWLWFTFVIRSAYQSVLIGALKTDNLVGNFADLREAINNGYHYGGRVGVFAYFEHDPSITANFQIVTEEKYEKVFHDILEGKDNCVLATSLEYAWAYCLAMGKQENECGHVLPDSIITVPLVVWTRMFSPFLRPLSLWLSRFMETGLLDHDGLVKPAIGIAITSDPSPLTIHQVLSVILCLVLGYFLSVVAFALELLRNKIKNVSLERPFTWM